MEWAPRWSRRPLRQGGRGERVTTAGIAKKPSGEVAAPPSSNIIHHRRLLAAAGKRHERRSAAVDGNMEAHTNTAVGSVVEELLCVNKVSSSNGTKFAEKSKI